jgi:hypothetical protein
MTIGDIARVADVSVESVLRVLNRDEVSSDVAACVREAIERCGYGRISELASDARERSSEGAVPDPGDTLGRVRRHLQDALDGVEGELESASSGAPRPEAIAARSAADRMTVMDALLHRLAQDVDEIKLELRRAQSERLEDLTLVVDLITTSWRAVDRRLASIDSKLDRLDGLWEHRSRSRLP